MVIQKKSELLEQPQPKYSNIKFFAKPTCLLNLCIYMLYYFIAVTSGHVQNTHWNLNSFSISFFHM